MNGKYNVGYESENDIVMTEWRTNLPTDSKSHGPTIQNNGSTISKDEESNCLQQMFKKHKRFFQITGYGLIHILVVSYFAYATHYFIQSEGSSEDITYEKDERCYGKCGFQWCNGYGMLIIITASAYFLLFYYLIFKPKAGKNIHENIIVPASHAISKFLKSWIILSIVILAAVVILGIYVYFVTQGSEERLICLLCPAIFISIGYFFSTDRRAIKWRPVVCGIICQFLLGVICMRLEIGRNIFQCTGDKVAQFLSYTNEGSKFVFGEEIVRKQIFAFAILPVIFFFSFFISILYYLGVMQWVITKLGWILQQLLGTTVCESVNAAANIFLGMCESPLLIRPYIKILTQSEMHAIMVSGFATVSGTVLAAYMSFGAQPAHLITASVMAAPATLAFSKLYFPESEESKTKSNNISLEESKDNSLLDAASNGASAGIEIILGIIANLVSFVAFIAFINAVVNWLGYLVGQDELTFEWIFAKLFIPLSWILGVPWEECDNVAKVIASKTIINEFVAYEKLGQFSKNGDVSARTNGIATFAICGFANPSSLGILIGSLGAMAPERKPEIAMVAFRAFVVGSIVSFVSASFAGLLMTDETLITFRNKTETENIF